MKPTKKKHIFFTVLLIASAHGFSQEKITITKKQDSLSRVFNKLADAVHQKMDSIGYKNPDNANYEKKVAEKDSLLQKRNSTTSPKEKKTLTERISKIQEELQEDDYLKELKTILLELEKDNSIYSFTELSSTTVKLIQEIKSINTLQKLITIINDDHELNNEAVKDKLLKAFSRQMNLIADRSLAWYNFTNKERRIIKGICLNSSNDLFTPVGLAEFFPFVKPNKNANFLQGNDDRDYTGGMLLEVATDYLKIQRRRAIKSYQRFMLGADVYTPYFRDSVKFKYDTSFNKSDRPHGSFQYIGFGTHAVSWNYFFRWDVALKFGKIGGTKAQILQTALHQDISYSPRPNGWAAQIANTGRLGFSVEFKPEWLLRFKHFGWNEVGPVNKFNAFFPSVTTDLSLGTFMTYAAVGLQFSNKNFYSTNGNYLIARSKMKIEFNSKEFWNMFMWVIKGNVRYVVHNTMLEGYGVFRTTEAGNDAFTPKSVYYLDDKQVKRVVGTIDIIVSKQSYRFTFFYKFSAISPETTFGKIGIFYPDGTEMDITNRWHRWATVGICFRLI